VVFFILTQPFVFKYIYLIEFNSIMKKILFTLITLLLISCSVDDYPKFHYVILPVESYNVPETVETGLVYPITVTYKLLSSCHLYEGFYYDIHENIRTIGIQNLVEERNNCNDLSSNSPEIEVSFNFSPMEIAPYTYIFRFYKGKDEEGNNIFEEVEIPVE